MLKLGLTRPGARKIQPTPEEQNQMLIDYGVAAGNIYDSKTELLERVESETDPVEVVVSSLSRWGTQIKDKIEGLDPSGAFKLTQSARSPGVHADWTALAGRLRK